jgi:hypothetical protein
MTDGLPDRDDRDFMPNKNHADRPSDDTWGFTPALSYEGRIRTVLSRLAPGAGRRVRPVSRPWPRSWKRSTVAKASCRLRRCRDCPAYRPNRLSIEKLISGSLAHSYRSLTHVCRQSEARALSSSSKGSFRAARTWASVAARRATIPAYLFLCALSSAFVSGSNREKGYVARHARLCGVFPSHVRAGLASIEVLLLPCCSP